MKPLDRGIRLPRMAARPPLALPAPRRVTLPQTVLRDFTEKPVGREPETATRVLSPTRSERPSVSSSTAS